MADDRELSKRVSRVVPSETKKKAIKTVVGSPTSKVPKRNRSDTDGAPKTVPEAFFEANMARYRMYKQPGIFVLLSIKGVQCFFPNEYLARFLL